MKRTNSRRTKSNVPIAAILSVVGGFIMIIGGISIIFMFGWYQSMFGGEGIFIMNRMMHSDDDDSSGDMGNGIGWWWPSMMIATSSGAMLGGLTA